MGIGWIIVLCIAGIIVLYLLVFIISALLVSPKEYNKNSHYYRWLLNSMTGIASVVARIFVTVTGKEMLPEGRFLLVCNHRSKFDPIMTWYKFRKYDIAFISKEENFHVFCFGGIIRRCCFMPIDRENPRNALRTMKHAADLITADEVSIGLYPEGTRSKDMNLLPFHNGSMKIAQMANVPIVVMTIQGTELIKKNFPLKHSRVYMDILKVYSAEEVQARHTNELGDEIHQLMLDKLGK